MRGLIVAAVGRCTTLICDQRALRHGLGLLLLLGGFGVAHLHAQGPPRSDLPLTNATLLDRWLQPDVVIGGVLVLLYAGELRGDVKRLKAEQKATADRLQNHYLTKTEIRAELRTIEAKIGGAKR